MKRWVIFLWLTAYLGVASSASLCNVPIVSENLLCLFKNLDDFIKEAEKAGNRLAIQAAEMIKEALVNWRTTNTQILKFGFDELDNANKQFFAKADSLIAGLDSVGKGNLATVEQINNQFSVALANLLFFDRRPRISYIRPRVIADGGDSVTITVAGLNLTNSAPELKVGTRVYKSENPSQTEATFTIPKIQIPFLDQRWGQLKMNLTLTMPKTIPEKLWPFSKPKTVSYPLSIRLAPKELARYKVYIGTREMVEVARNSGTHNYSLVNNNEKERCETHLFRPSEGFEIAYWALEKVTRVNGSFDFGKDEILPGGKDFTLCAKAKWKVSWLPSTTTTYEFGQVQAEISYIEVRKEKQEKYGPPHSGVVKLTGSQTIGFKPNPDKENIIRIELEGMGFTHTVFGSEYIEELFLQVDYDPSGRVTLTPKRDNFLNAWQAR